jgi:hypothetical protein
LLLSAAATPPLIFFRFSATDYAIIDDTLFIRCY